MIPVIALLLAVAAVFSAARFIRFLRNAILYRSSGFLRWHLSKLRLTKMDKESVFVISAQKSGSTHLSYICALLNTRNEITKFRNDFDVLPILTFPRRWIAQNFNARQDGKYQMYKINGSLRFVDGSVMAVEGARRIIWTCREFNGYFCSVWWWARVFYPRKARRIFHVYNLMGWKLFKALTFKAIVQDHVEDCWYGYNRVNSSKPGDFIAVFYEHLVKEKPKTLRMLARWLEIDLDDATIGSIAEKTSKEAMSAGDRFDPINFGDGGGVSKVNIDPHAYKLDAAEMEYYNEVFRRRFSGTGIGSYAEYIEKMRAMQLERLGREHADLVTA